MVYALDPDAKGKISLADPRGQGSTNGGVQWGMASDGRNVYAAVSDLARLPAKGGVAAPSNADLDPNQGGGLTSLDLITGNKVWFMPAMPARRHGPVAARAVRRSDCDRWGGLFGFPRWSYPWLFDR
jgi:hypothetical protein